MRLSTLVSSLSVAAMVVSTAACQRDDAGDSSISQRLKHLEEQNNQIIAMLQHGAGARGAAKPQRARPKPEVTYAVPIEGSPSVGRKDALVTVVEGFDFACPYCERARGTVDQIIKDYPNDVRVVYRNFVVHPQVATTPALASCAAAKQGKYVQMNHLIWDKGYNAGRNLGADNMEKLAQEVGLDLDRFKADMNGADCKHQLQTDRSELARVGVGGTPAFYVNGRFVFNRSTTAFKSLIDEELKKAKERVAQGTKPADYYKTWVIDKGQKTL